MRSVPPRTMAISTIIIPTAPEPRVRIPHEARHTPRPPIRSRPHVENPRSGHPAPTVRRIVNEHVGVAVVRNVRVLLSVRHPHPTVLSGVHPLASGHRGWGYGRLGVLLLRGRRGFGLRGRRSRCRRGLRRHRGALLLCTGRAWRNGKRQHEQSRIPGHDTSSNNSVPRIFPASSGEAASPSPSKIALRATSCDKLTLPVGSDRCARRGA